MSTTIIRRPKLIRNERGGRFKLLIGVHFGQGPKDCACDACMTSDGKNHNYHAGDILASEQDLERRCNQGPHSRKFERVADDAPLTGPWTEDGDEAKPPQVIEESTVQESDLQKMSIGQLKAFASENSIDLQGKTTKAEILEHVLTALTD